MAVTSAETRLSVADAAKRLGIGVSTLRKWIRGKKVPTVRLGRRVWIRLADLDALYRQAVNAGRVGIESAEPLELQETRALTRIRTLHTNADAGPLIVAESGGAT